MSKRVSSVRTHAGSAALATLGALCLALASAYGCNSSDDNSATTTTGGTGSGSGGGSATGGTTTGTGGTTVNGCPAGTTAPVGLFTLSLTGTNPALGITEAYSNLIGSVLDGPANESITWEATLCEGACQLLVPKNPFCDPACSSGTKCVGGNTCRADPTAHSVGTVTVSGVKTTSGATQVTANPVAPKYSYQPAGLAYPPADEGAEVRLSAAGGDYPAFEVKTTGIKTLELTGPDPIPMQQDQPLSLSWTPKGSAGQSRMQIALNISVHGGNKGKIKCDVADNGSLQIPATMVNELIKLGVAGYPTVAFTRTSVGSADITPGRVDFQVSMTVERALSIPGVTSCGDTDPCPDGKTCNAVRVCE